MEQYLINSFSLNKHQVIIDSSQIRRLNVRELRDIHIEYNGKVINATKHDIYVPRAKFVKSVPYVFIDRESSEQVLNFFKTYSRRNRLAAEKKYMTNDKKTAVAS